MNEKYYSSYNATANDGTTTYQRPKPTYDKELLWQNRMKYLGHKRALSALYTFDIVLGIFGMMIAKSELSASVLTVTCLENRKVLIISAVAFAVTGIILSTLLGGFWYIIFFILYAAQMGISLILSKNLEYLKTQFGYPYFNESIADSMMNKTNL